MKILITGFAGFIGFHASRELLRRGWEVVGIDNFCDYYNVKLKRDRAALLEGQPGFSARELDICDHAKLHGVFTMEAPDVVLNLAAQPGVRYSIDHPFVYEKTNLEGFLNVLECCRHAAKVPKLVYASSSSVYGGNKKMPFEESDKVDNPVSLYAATKKADELMAHTYSHLYGMQAIGLRFFTVYGAWYRPDMALSLFAYSFMTYKQQSATTAGQPGAGVMKFMMVYFMPFMMLCFMNSYASGLCYYYFLSQLLTMLIMFIIRRSVNDQKVRERLLANASKPRKKSKFQERYEEALRQQQEQLNREQRRQRR